jgi:hypothetical protein
MKKQMKKLVLAKETVRSLENDVMGKAVGGDSTNLCYPTFYNSYCRYCVDEPITVETC